MRNNEIKCINQYYREQLGGTEILWRDSSPPLPPFSVIPNLKSIAFQFTVAYIIVGINI